MARGNGATEEHVVALAGLTEHDVVLVLGPGPGIGLQAAARAAGTVVGVDPSELMLAACRRRCGELIAQGRVQLKQGVAECTGLPDDSVNVAIAVNNVQIWPDQLAGFGELRRVLRPGGRVLVSVHQKWLPGGPAALTDAVSTAGFADLQSWTWEPPGRGATTAVQLRARKGTV